MPTPSCDQRVECSISAAAAEPSATAVWRAGGRARSVDVRSGGVESGGRTRGNAFRLILVWGTMTSSSYGVGTTLTEVRGIGAQKAGRIRELVGTDG